MARLPKPEPIVTSTVCSVCDLPWEDHGDAPTLADCVRLLKQRPQPVQWYPYYPNTWQPQWTYTYSGHNTVNASSTTLHLVGDTGTEFMSGDEPPDDAVPAAV